MTLRKWVSTAWVVGRERKSYHSAWSRVHEGERARHSRGTRWDAVKARSVERQKPAKCRYHPANAIVFSLQSSATGCRRGSRSGAQDFHGALKKAVELTR